MEKTILEKAIEKRAEKRFNNEYSKACKIITSSPILNSIKIGDYKLGTNGYGICPASDLFISEKTNLIKATNFEQVKAALIKKYTQDETDNLLNKVDMIQDFIESNV